MRIPSSLLALVAVASLIGCIPEEAPTPPPVEATAPVDAGPPAAANTGDVPTDSKSLLATVEAMKDQLKSRPRDFNVDAALANLFYDNGKYIDAIEYYTNALDRLAAAEKRLDPTAKIAGPVPEGCRLETNAKQPTTAGTPARTVEEAVTYADSIATQNPAGAAACLSQLVAPLAGVHARRGNSWYLIGNTDKARGDHQAALRLDPNNPEALFFSGAVELETAHGDPVKLAAGKAFWERLLKAAPEHPRAALVKETLPRINELFGAKPGAMPGDAPGVAAGGPSAPALPAGMAESMQNVQHTPEMDAQLDKTMDEGEALLAKKEWQKALDTFKQVMPLRPNGRTALGMGIALRELGKPMAERVLQNATTLPGGEPARAKYELAILYETKDPAQAKSLLQEVSSDPKIGAEAKARLAKLP
jgi:tetratricopeptide (TPR) repeat protein